MRADEQECMVGAKRKRLNNIKIMAGKKTGGWAIVSIVSLVRKTRGESFLGADTFRLKPLAI
jgi:hypothetical protein